MSERIAPFSADTEPNFLKEKLLALCPEVFQDGKLNIEELQALLSEESEEDGQSKEYFGLNWPGKANTKRIALKKAIGSTLSYAKDEGLNPKATHNIFIEGDNLQIMQIMKHAYDEKIKMIYIDPPYNTGKDFIYKDKFESSIEDYLSKTGQRDGNSLLVANPKSQGRYHTNWLNFMYPRLRVAKELLVQDGVIFVSIGDNEIANLILVMNEVFGEENHVSTFIWNSEGHTDNQLEVKINHEYIVCYKKANIETVLSHIVDPNTRKESNLWRGFAENSITKNGPANPPSWIELPAGFPCVAKSLQLTATGATPNFFANVEQAGYITREITNQYGYAYPIREDDIVVQNGQLINSCKVFAGWANANKLKTFISSGFKPIEEPDGNITFYLSNKGVIYYKKERSAAKNILSVLRNFSTTEKTRSDLEKVGVYFSYPKPVDLIQYICDMGLDDGDIVMDFFAGSGTVGHAVYNLIAKGKNIQYILTQLPETVPGDSLAYQKGFRYINEICKKRLMHFAKEYISEKTKGDFGFKVFKLNKSNFNLHSSYIGSSVAQLSLSFQETTERPLVDNWTKPDLTTELMLLEGFPLHSTHKPQSQYTENEVVAITSDFNQNTLYLCLDEQLHEETVIALAIDPEDVFICLDSALADLQKVRLDDKLQLKTV